MNSVIREEHEEGASTVFSGFQRLCRMPYLGWVGGEKSRMETERTDALATVLVILSFAVCFLPIEGV
jgi:hypothetical protein